MRASMRWAPALLLLLALDTAWAAKPAPAAATKKPRLATVTFGVRHRVFHEFRDLHTVKLNETFPLGDSDYSARVIQYLADFQMDLHAHKTWSMSDEPRNPAFRIVVSKGKTPQDTTWAFLKSPPHFGAHSYFAFQVLRIDFANHAPLLADTTSAQAAPPSHAATAPADSAKSR